MAMRANRKVSAAVRGKAERVFHGQFLRYVRDAYPKGCVGKAETKLLFSELVAGVRERAERRAVALEMSQATAAAAEAAEAEAAALPGLEDTQRLDAAMAFLREHFRTATIRDVAAASGWTMFHFHRRFKQWAGRTPKDMMSQLQVDHAKELIAEGKLALDDVAVRCGFAHQSHLTDRFKRLVGTTPARWLSQRKREALDAAYDQQPIAKAA